MNRTTINKRMQLETAIKAVDFLYRHSSQSHIISIGFYGGEPLLEFDLIQKVVDYAEGLFKGKSLQFFNDDKCNALVSKRQDICVNINFITISLDGPQSIHNKKPDICRKQQGIFSGYNE